MLYVDSSVLLHDNYHGNVVYCRIWDIECGACLKLLEGHDDLVRYVCVLHHYSFFSITPLHCTLCCVIRSAVVVCV